MTSLPPLTSRLRRNDGAGGVSLSRRLENSAAAGLDDIIKTPAAIFAGMAFALGLATTPASAAEASMTFTREQVTGYIADFRKIVSQNGVEEQLEVPIDGTSQWITVRGRDRSNPVLLVIHGGPASPETPISWAYQQGWEDYFTVVQWDQRGAGKTYNANDPDVIGPTLSLERIVKDSAEMVEYLRERYDKRKVFVLGNSWGSLVGLSLAHEHPELLYAYVGMDQVINGADGERVAYQMTLKAAEAAGNAEATKDLRSIAPYPEKDGSAPLDKISLVRKWSTNLGGVTHGRASIGYYFNIGKLSPDYTEADLEAIDKGSALSLVRMLPELTGFNYTHVTDFKTPIIMFEGRYDMTTPPSVVADWFAHVKAPSKKFVWFDAAHMVAVETPGAVLVHLVLDVRPLAGAESRTR